MTDGSIVKIDLGGLSKPATALIEKVSAGIGGIFKPWQIVRVAEAKAEAERIRMESQIQVNDLHRRAMYRFLEEEAKKQLNIEEITLKALPQLKENSTPQDVDDDWITNFFDKCRIVSDEDMQKLWSRILAGEANSPGSFSRQTVNITADLDKIDAELFTRLCGFSWVLGEITPIIYDVQDNIYNQHNINFDTLRHLESLGIVTFNVLTGFVRLDLPKKTTTSYYGREVVLTLSKDVNNELDLGKVILTRPGQELAHICESKPVDGFFEFIYKKWEKMSLVPKKENE